MVSNPSSWWYLNCPIPSNQTRPTNSITTNPTPSNPTRPTPGNPTRPTNSITTNPTPNNPTRPTPGNPTPSNPNRPISLYQIYSGDLYPTRPLFL